MAASASSSRRARPARAGNKSSPRDRRSSASARCPSQPVRRWSAPCAVLARAQSAATRPGQQPYRPRRGGVDEDRRGEFPRRCRHGPTPGPITQRTHLGVGHQPGAMPPPETQIARVAREHQYPWRLGLEDRPHHRAGRSTGPIPAQPPPRANGCANPAGKVRPRFRPAAPDVPAPQTSARRALSGWGVRRGRRLRAPKRRGWPGQNADRSVAIGPVNKAAERPVLW